MSPSSTPRIMLIRHAEKPGDDPPPHGVNIAGHHDSQSLLVQGWQRAGALATLFAPARGSLQSPSLATPEYLFASGNAGSMSERPVQTLTPFANRAGVAINSAYSVGGEASAARAAMAQTGPVLICWQHHGIPAIANTIMGNTTSTPQKWPGKRFDLVWIFDLRADGSYAFSQVPQLLVAGDLDSVVTTGG